MRILRYVALLLVLLAGIDGWAQYNPTNPDEPGTAPWTLTLKSVPADAGSFNISKVTSRAAGASVTVKASNNGNYYFQQWEQEDGTVVSTSASYTFTMPAANKPERQPKLKLRVCQLDGERQGDFHLKDPQL